VTVPRGFGRVRRRTGSSRRGSSLSPRRVADLDIWAVFLASSPARPSVVRSLDFQISVLSPVCVCVFAAVSSPKSSSPPPSARLAEPKTKGRYQQRLSHFFSFAHTIHLHVPTPSCHVHVHIVGFFPVKTSLCPPPTSFLFLFCQTYIPPPQPCSVRLSALIGTCPSPSESPFSFSILLFFAPKRYQFFFALEPTTIGTPNHQTTEPRIQLYRPTHIDSTKSPSIPG
jgi:hypothetical protein